MKLKEFILPGLIFLLATILRFLWLDRVPTAITGDELTYILNIKSVALTGTGLRDNWSLLSALFFKYPIGLPQAELPYFILLPAVSFFNLSLLNVRLIYAAISIATAFAMYLVVRELFDKKTALIAAFITAVNPWQIFIGRTTYETVPAMLFFLLGIYFLLREKSSRIFLSLIFFVLAFYSYIGTKVAFVPLILAVSFFAWLQNKKKFTKQYVILNIACLLLVMFFASSLLSKGGNSRSGELFTPFVPEIAQRVDEVRKNSISPHFVQSALDNKFTIYSKIISEKFITASSPQYLFVAADNFVGLYTHGLFYIIDALFLVIGMLFSFAEKRRQFILVSALLVIGTFPHLFFKARTDVFSPHLALFFTFSIIFIAYGISKTISSSKLKIIPVIILLLYLVSVINFANIYLMQFPLRGHFDFASRVLSSYLTRVEQNGSSVTAYISTPEDAFSKYLFYTDGLNKDTIGNAKNAISKKEYLAGTMKFLPCGEIHKNLNPNDISIYQSSICEPYEYASGSAKITNLMDGGEGYRIFGDPLCSRFNLKSYPQGLKISDFIVEKLSDRQFCESFIMRSN